MKTTALTVSRTIPAAAAEVFDVWMDPRRPGSPWYGAAQLLFDGKVDGLFYLVIEHAGQRWPHFGRFVAIERPARLEYTWMSEPTHGLESVVTVRFEPRGAETLVTVHHGNLPDDADGRQHVDGWTFVLTMLEQRFARP